MQSTTPRRLATPRPGAILALLAGVLVAPVEAEAGCGRHLAIPPGMAEVLDRLTPADSTASPRPVAPASPAPCNGPSCSGQPAPAPSPSPIPPNPVQDWALGSVAPLVDDPGPALAPRDDASHRPVHVAGSIFHPPRPRRSSPTS